jgi:hypothetical protein
VGGVLKGITSAITPIANTVAPFASLIPGVGQSIGLADAALNTVNNMDGGASGGGGTSPYLTAAQAAAAADAAAKKSAGYTSAAEAQQSAAAQAALKQYQTILANTQDPSVQSRSASFTDPSSLFYVAPQTQSSVIPSSYGAALTNAPQGAAPNSYQAAIGAGMGTTASPTLPGPTNATVAPAGTTATTATGAKPPGAPAWVMGADGFLRAPDPNNSQYQMSYNPSTGKYDFSDPYTKQSQWNVGGAGGAGSLAQAEQNFVNDFGTPGGAIGTLPTGTPTATPTAKPVAAPTVRKTL